MPEPVASGVAMAAAEAAWARSVLSWDGDPEAVHAAWQAAWSAALEWAAQQAEQAARDAHAQQAEPGAERIRQDSWAKALTWFAMELRTGTGRRAREIAQRAEEVHAEHHPGYIVPSLDSCPEHTRAEYEQMVAGLLRQDGGGGDG